MKNDVLGFVKENNLFNQGDSLFLAVSGGSDSMAMLHFFAQIQETMDLNLVTLTVDHQLRGGESREDTLFVKSQSESLSIPCEILSVDVREYQAKFQVGVQEAARNLRYEAFKRIVKDSGKLVLAHHGDDQVETMFMQLAKGVVPFGMKTYNNMLGMTIIRPFLSVTKDELLHYIEEESISYREDPSNSEESYTRNRFRHHLLPFIKNENNSIHISANRLHHQLADDEAFLVEMARKEMESISQFCEHKVTFSVNLYRNLPQPLQRRGFHLILNYLSVNKIRNHDYFPSFIEWLSSNQANSEWSPNGEWKAVKTYDQCTITTFLEAVEPYHFELNINEHVKLPNGWKIKLEEVTQENIGADMFNEAMYICGTEMVNLPLTVRTRQPGDRIRPLGLKGRKKVKDIFIDEKIAKTQRDLWPIVESNQGEIFWIPFISKSHLANQIGTSNYKLTIEVEQN
ncbi:tRNA lysidine(34) synthetase TilS [Alkalibacillus silvisoli]|uniref:tRNA(Ile)-lysidine synthase n=1 Tax=Alkalibacillus silvisoli TaxID=392823 RepID=A0ABP3JK50_9BACI